MFHNHEEKRKGHVDARQMQACQAFSVFPTLAALHIGRGASHCFDKRGDPKFGKALAPRRNTRTDRHAKCWSSFKEI